MAISPTNNAAGLVGYEPKTEWTRDNNSGRYSHSASYGDDFTFEIDDGIDVGKNENIDTAPNYVVLVPRFNGIIRDGKRSVKVDKHNLHQVWDRLTTNGKKADSFYAVVGVIDGTNEHAGIWPSMDISYDFLFRVLIKNGYDPLLPLRKDSFRRGFENSMGNEIIRAINSHDTTTLSIKERLKHIVKDAANFVKDYISGGDKPQLESSTLKNRKYRKDSGLAAYPNGVDMPLSETGQLENAIKFKVFAIRSLWRKDYYKHKRELIKKEKERRAKEKRVTARSREKGYDQSLEYQARKEEIRKRESVRKPKNIEEAFTAAKIRKAEYEYNNLSKTKEFRDFVSKNWDGQPFEKIPIMARRQSVELYKIIMRKGKAVL